MPDVCRGGCFPEGVKADEPHRAAFGHLVLYGGDEAIEETRGGRLECFSIFSNGVDQILLVHGNSRVSTENMIQHPTTMGVVPFVYLGSIPARINGRGQ